MKRTPLLLAALLWVGAATATRADDDMCKTHGMNCPAATEKPAEPSVAGNSNDTDKRVGGYADMQQKWEQAHRRLHEILGQLRGDESGDVRTIGEKMDRAMEAYERTNLTDKQASGEPISRKDYWTLIRAARTAGIVAKNSDRLADIHNELRKPLPTDRRNALISEGNHLNDKITDAMMPTYSQWGGMPDDLHKELMSNPGPNNMNPELKNIGFQMGKHFGEMEGYPGTSSPGTSIEAGRSHLDEGDPAAAKASADRALAMDPRSADALSVRAQANAGLRDFPAAVQDAQAALRIDPRQQGAAAVMNLYAGRNAASTVSGEAADAKGAGGADGSGAGGYAAGGAAGAANSVSPGGSDSYLNIGTAKMRLRDFDAAEKDLSRAVELNPYNADALAMRAKAYVQLGRYQDAIADADSILRRKLGDPTALATKAYALNRLGRYASARETSLQILRRNPGDAAGLFNRGLAEFGLHDRKTALEFLRQAAEKDSARYGSFYDRARTAPEDADASFLFDDAGAAGPDAGRRPVGGSSRNLWLVLGIVVGGFLMALGLLHGLSAQWSRKMRAGATAAEDGDTAPATPGYARAAAGTPTPGSRNLVGGTYEIVKQIGVGGMGLVYEARDRSLGRRVAVKKMREEIRVDPRERERFLKEARTVAAMHHTNIVDIYSIVDDGPDVFLVFEFVEGKTLHEELSKRGRLPLRDAAKLFQGVCAALDYAHRRDIIHRDLKPSNIMVDVEGTVKVMDFGVARQAKETLNRLAMTNTIVGTPPYMAPEQEQGVVCKESDIYALGICLYEVLTGRMPFAGSGAGLLLNKMNKAYTPASAVAPDLPTAVDEVLARALEPEPEKRIRSAREFLALLESVAVGR